MSSSSKSLLRPLSKSVYYWSPPTPSSSPRSTRRPLDAAADSDDPHNLGVDRDDDPSLLICFGWMDAQLRHVEKYLVTYRKLFPTSPILLLQSSQRGFYSTRNRLETLDEFKPAIDTILDVELEQERKLQQQQHEQRQGSTNVDDVDQKKKKNKNKMLVHVFSNGGCMSLKWLNEELVNARRTQRRQGRENPSTGSEREPATEKTRLVEPGRVVATSAAAGEATTTARRRLGDEPGRVGLGLSQARAIVFDSCPGKSSLLVTMRAFSAPIRSRWLKLPTMGLLAVLHGFISIYNLIARKKPILDRLSAWLNDRDSLPVVPRLYLYSKVDELIPYRDVERHAVEARDRLGVAQVETERFEQTSHVGHVRGDPERYWRAIERVWRQSRHV
ncbi:hypothetical protein JCM3766R1_003503 [Sporobolomyces carnicolor]